MPGIAVIAVQFHLRWWKRSSSDIWSADSILKRHNSIWNHFLSFIFLYAVDCILYFSVNSYNNLSFFWNGHTTATTILWAFQTFKFSLLSIWYWYLYMTHINKQDHQQKDLPFLYFYYILVYRCIFLDGPCCWYHLAVQWSASPSPLCNVTFTTYIAQWSAVDDFRSQADKQEWRQIRILNPKRFKSDLWALLHSLPEQMHEASQIENEAATTAGGGACTAFVHRSRQSQHKRNVPYGCFTLKRTENGSGAQRWKVITSGEQNSSERMSFHV